MRDVFFDARINNCRTNSWVSGDLRRHDAFFQGGKIHVAESTKSELSGYGFDFEDGGTVDCKVCIQERNPASNVSLLPSRFANRTTQKTYYVIKT